MIVLDTTVLVYAKGADHRLREPCRRLIQAIERGAVQATTTAEAIQEFAHVRARRRDRTDAARLGGAYVDLLSPLLAITEGDLRAGLALFERYPGLGAFDATIAAVAIGVGAQALVSADRAFAAVEDLPHIDPGTPRLEELIGG